MNWDSDKIKSLRLRLGWSPSDLARRLNCESCIVAGWEKGSEPLEAVFSQELDILLKQADSTADEVTGQALAEVFWKSLNCNNVN